MDNEYVPRQDVARNRFRSIVTDFVVELALRFSKVCIPMAMDQVMYPLVSRKNS